MLPEQKHEKGQTVFHMRMCGDVYVLLRIIAGVDNRLMHMLICSACLRYEL